LPEAFLLLAHKPAAAAVEDTAVVAEATSAAVLAEATWVALAEVTWVASAELIWPEWAEITLAVDDAAFTVTALNARITGLPILGRTPALTER
jgi:hypothetical protein